MTKTPQLIVFDVNETLSDLSTVGDTFEEVGATDAAREDLVRLGASRRLRARLTDETPAFADVARGCATVVLSTLELSRPLDDAVDAGDGEPQVP